MLAKRWDSSGAPPDASECVCVRSGKGRNEVDGVGWGGTMYLTGKMGGVGAGAWLTVSSVISSDIKSGKVESNVSPASSSSIWAVSMGVTSES